MVTDYAKKKKKGRREGGGDGEADTLLILFHLSDSSNKNVQTGPEWLYSDYKGLVEIKKQKTNIHTSISCQFPYINVKQPKKISVA